MPDRCVHCHQSHPEVDIGLLRIQYPASPFGSGAPQWTLSQQQYCGTCYRQAEQYQYWRELAKLSMVLLPMIWMLFSGTLIYGGLYTDPATAPIEAHLFFFGASLAAFYAIPATIHRHFKRFYPTPETSDALPDPVACGSR